VLDDHLHVALQKFECILGIWRGILSSHLFQPPQNAILSTLFLSLHSSIGLKDEIEATLGFMINKFPQITDRLPLALILGKQIHRIPWESLPIVVESRSIITWISSLRVVSLQKQIPVEVDPESASYILNLKGDLNETGVTFYPIFQNLSWQGLVRRPPDSSIIEQALQERDLFIYCGHGSGTEFFDCTALLEEHRECRAAMLLMECSSGELIDDGDMDPFGVPYACLGAGSGCVVANLWNVTDRDIDRFLMELLKQTVLSGPTGLAEAVAIARNSCKLKYLTGAAPVIYGFLTLVQSRGQGGGASMGSMQSDGISHPT
jgi:separase